MDNVIRITKGFSNEPIPKEKDNMGLTIKEKIVHDKLMECYKSFLDLDFQHPEDNREFSYAVHLIQGLLSLRVVRRCYPDGWATYEYIKKEEI
jgi:hypothetical protein